jgi:hypothetical protein
VGIFAIGIEHPLDMTVQRLHDSNPRHHRRTASRHQHQRRDRGLPFRQRGFLVRRDAQGHELAAVRERDRLVKFAARAWSAFRHLPRPGNIQPRERRSRKGGA